MHLYLLLLLESGSEHACLRNVKMAVRSANWLTLHLLLLLDNC